MLRASSTSPRPATSPWYRQFWPWLLISIPAATVVAGAVTIWLAAREPVALVHDDYYKEGLAINRDLARDRKAALLQLRATLWVDANNDRLHGRLAPEAEAGTLSLLFIHPVARQHDRSVEVALEPDGSFALDLPVDRGRWYIELQPADDTGWRLQGEIDLSAAGVTELAALGHSSAAHPPPPPAAGNR